MKEMYLTFDCLSNTHTHRDLIKGCLGISFLQGNTRAASQISNHAF